MLNLRQKAIEIARETSSESAFMCGYDLACAEYEEKLRWIPVEEKEPPTELLLMKLSNGEIRLGEFSAQFKLTNGLMVKTTRFRIANF